MENNEQTMAQVAFSFVLGAVRKAMQDHGKTDIRKLSEFEQQDWLHQADDLNKAEKVVIRLWDNWIEQR